MGTTSALFDFFDEVTICAEIGPLSTLNGRVATVIGKVFDNEQRWYYTVSIDPDHECWCAFEHELQPTGRRRDESEFYDGKRIKVIVDESGQGHVAE